MSLTITARATGYFSALPILQLIGYVLVAWNVSHKPLTLPQIKELLHDGDGIHILPLMDELLMNMWRKNMKYCSFFSPFYPKSMSMYNTIFIVKKRMLFWILTYFL
jgi:hypothetical protein